MRHAVSGHVRRWLFTHPALRPVGSRSSSGSHGDTGGTETRARPAEGAFRHPPGDRAVLVREGVRARSRRQVPRLPSSEHALLVSPNAG